MQTKRIGIYISAFDPIHEGHLKFADAAVTQNDLDKLYFLVDPKPKYSQGVKAFNHRLNMVMLAIEYNPKFGTIVLTPKSTMDEYLPVIQTRFKDYDVSLIFPQEAVSRFIKWPYLLSSNSNSRLNLAIGTSFGTQTDVSAKLELLSQTSGIKFNHSLFSYSAEPINLKSSHVRRSLRRGEKPDEISPAVYDYINQESLYYSPSTA